MMKEMELEKADETKQWKGEKHLENKWNEEKWRKKVSRNREERIKWEDT